MLLTAAADEVDDEDDGSIGRSFVLAIYLSDARNYSVS